MSPEPAGARPELSSGLPSTISGVHAVPPLREASERDDLARKLVVVAALRIALVTLSLGAAFVAVDLHRDRPEDISTWEYTLITVAYAVSLGYALALRSRYRVEVLAYAQVVVDSVLVTWLVLATGGSESVFSFAYVFVVLGAAMTLYRLGAVISVVLSLLMFGTLVLLQLEGTIYFLPRPDRTTAGLSFFMYALGLGLVGFLASTLAETARRRGRLLAEKENEFEQLAELQAAILRSLPAGLITVDGNGAVRYANEAAQAILAQPAARLTGRQVEQVAPSIAGPWSVIQRQERTPHPRERFEGNYKRPDGRTIRLGFSFAPLSSRPEDFGVIVVFQDVTDIVRLKEAVARAERLASIGELAAGLAHEVRNPLASMCASIDVLRQAIDPPEALRRLMLNVVYEADRLNVLITDFLEFARPRRLNLERTDISALIGGVAELCRNDTAMSKLELRVSVEPGLEIVGDAGALRQVVWNLVRNAGQALGGGPGTIEVTAARVDGGAELRVRDDGPGIAPEVQRRIFDPFYTTKEKGTGLGLAIVQSIIEAHGGTVLLDSEPGRGTELVLRLPHNAPPSSLPPPEDTDPALELMPSRVELLGGSP